MTKKLFDPIGRLRSDRSVLSPGLETARYLNEKNSSARRQNVPIQAIAAALVASGYTCLDSQAKALGLHRSTTWTIVKNKHKLGRLNRQTAQRILANPDTPPSVRAIIQQALAEN
jgi:hypothetical protein